MHINQSFVLKFPGFEMLQVPVRQQLLHRAADGRTPLGALEATTASYRGVQKECVTKKTTIIKLTSVQLGLKVSECTV